MDGGTCATRTALRLLPFTPHSWVRLSPDSRGLPQCRPLRLRQHFSGDPLRQGLGHHRLRHPALPAITSQAWCLLSSYTQGPL